MKTEDAIDEQMTPTGPGQGHSKGTSWLAGLGALVVVALVIGASAIIFAQLGQHHKSQSPNSSIPPPGKWIQVLNGYSLASLAAGDSNPSILYACAVHSQTSTPQATTGNDTSYTILRSTDFGGQWQDIGSNTAMGSSCQLAVNPGNSNELYAIGLPNVAQATSILKHSTDGGQTWTTIAPALNMPGNQSAPMWNVEQLSMVGNALFGVQLMPQDTNPTVHPGVLPKYYARLSRLVRSTDGGHTWTVLDQQFTTSWQAASSYAVDPSNTSTIYELVGIPSLPVQPKVTEPGVPTVYASSFDLYKTTDKGATWQPLLKNLPFATQVQLARSNPQIIYVGGTRTPLPALREVPVYDNINTFGFHLQVSTDGGATWRQVPDLPQTSQAFSVPAWFVRSNGQVYFYPAGSTASPSSPGSPASIQRYDPSRDAWSEVTRPPIDGTLLAVTSDGATSDVLWFVGTSKGQSVMYRYVV
jgi:hypothetical protein